MTLISLIPNPDPNPRVLQQYFLPSCPQVTVPTGMSCRLSPQLMKVSHLLLLPRTPLPKLQAVIHSNQLLIPGIHGLSPHTSSHLVLLTSGLDHLIAIGMSSISMMISQMITPQLRTLNFPSLTIMKKTNKQPQIPGLCQAKDISLGRTHTPQQKVAAQGRTKTPEWHLPWQKPSIGRISWQGWLPAMLRFRKP